MHTCGQTDCSHRPKHPFAEPLEFRQARMGVPILRNLTWIPCPVCGAEHGYSDRELDGGRNPRNAHRWDGEPSGSYWRGCSERDLSCRKNGERFHVDVDKEP